jgi:hypothetical protein
MWRELTGSAEIFTTSKPKVVFLHPRSPGCASPTIPIFYYYVSFFCMLFLFGFGFGVLAQEKEISRARIFGLSSPFSSYVFVVFLNDINK